MTNPRRRRVYFCLLGVEGNLKGLDMPRYILPRDDDRRHHAFLAAQAVVRATYRQTKIPHFFEMEYERGVEYGFTTCAGRPRTMRNGSFAVRLCVGGEA